MYFQESVIKDITTLIQGTSGLVGELAKRRRDTVKSLTRSTSDLIATFHIIASSGMEQETAAMISKAYEKQCMTLLQILFSSMGATRALDAREYLQQVHTNTSFDDGEFTVNVAAEGAIDTDSDIDLDNIDESTIMDEEDPKNESILNKYEEMVTEGWNNIKNDPAVSTQLIYGGPINDRFTINRQPKDSMGREFAITEAPAIRADNNRGHHRHYPRNYDPHAENNVNYPSKEATDYFKNQTLNQEYKKANELMPSLMVIHFVSLQDGQQIPHDAIIGVKAKVIAVPAADIIDHIVDEKKDSHTILNIIKATSREISFWKDLIFTTSKAKKQALEARKNRGESIWHQLERMASISKMASGLGLGTMAAATTLLAITSEEATFLMNNYQIDLNNPREAWGLIQSYNLMGLCIVDEEKEIAKFLWDGDEKAYQTVTFRNLEREKDDNYKKIINLLGKVGR